MRWTLTVTPLILVCILGLASGSPPAAPHPTEPHRLTLLDAEEQAALARLMNPPHFAYGPVGVAASVPPQVQDFQTLLGSPAADAAFKELLTRADHTGRLYGLCGIHFTDPDSFPSAATDLLRSGGTVNLFVGCLKGNDPILNVLNGPHGIISGAIPESLRTFGRYPSREEFLWLQASARQQP